MTTLQLYIYNLPSKPTLSPCSIPASYTKTNNHMSCPPTVGDPLISFDTPGPSPDKTTPQQKTYAAALFSKATQTTSSPLGLDQAAWTPLASMATDPLPNIWSHLTVLHPKISVVVNHKLVAIKNNHTKTSQQQILP